MIVAITENRSTNNFIMEGNYILRTTAKENIIIGTLKCVIRLN